jgi:hypothetical protein
MFNSDFPSTLKQKDNHKDKNDSLLKMISPPLLGELFCGGKNKKLKTITNHFNTLI